MSERRKNPRWETTELLRQMSGVRTIFIEVKDTKTRKPIGHLLDLSREGLRIICSSVMQKGTFCSFTFELPVGKGKSETVFVDARCVWSERIGEESSYKAGFVFTAIHEASRKRIDALLDGKEAVNFQTSQ